MSAVRLDLVRPWVAMLATCWMLGGCFFGHGKHMDPEAFVRPQADGSQVVEFREMAWFTGNIHIPFDFTVYESDAIYELKVPALEGEFDVKDLEISRCGHRLYGASGTVRLSKERMVVSLDAGPPDGARREPSTGSFKLVPADAQQRRCESRKR